MGDMGEIFKDMIEHSKKKRAKNREGSAQYLWEQGISFDTMNNGVHLIVKGGKGIFADFWPGTGKWKIRGHNIEGRGVKSLAKKLLA